MIKEESWLDILILSLQKRHFPVGKWFFFDKLLRNEGILALIPSYYASIPTVLLLRAGFSTKLVNDSTNLRLDSTISHHFSTKLLHYSTNPKNITMLPVFIKRKLGPHREVVRVFAKLPR